MGSHQSDTAGNLTGSATATINRPVGEVFAAITDITRMGEWSPECTGCRWNDGATEAALGASFSGDNVAEVGPITLKRWTTVSTVTDFVPNETFEFVAADFTRWRYEFAEDNGATVVTESFSYAPYTGFKGLVYGKLLARDKALVKGMQATLDRVKAAVEA